MKVSEIKKQIKGVFKLPVKAYYFGKVYHGSPYFYPWRYNSTILTIRKERPQFSRCKYFKLFGYEISYGWPVAFVSYELGWKDKYDSPRFEWDPCTQILFFGLQFCMWDIAPVKDCDCYWEMVLWYLKYSDSDIKKAEETWGWKDYTTKLSTWNKECLI